MMEKEAIPVVTSSAKSSVTGARLATTNEVAGVASKVGNVALKVGVGVINIFAGYMLHVSRSASKTEYIG